MNIGFYSPYLDSMSGGERYVLTLAANWAKKHTVSIFWDDPSVIVKAKKILNIDISQVKIVENIFKSRNIFKKMLVTRGYDLIFFLTDGSIPTSFTKRNMLHFQVPFEHVSVSNQKLSKFQTIVCNSNFTKKHIDPIVGRNAIVIYPPVTPVKKMRMSKKNIILSVGRFHPLKKQGVLIEAFRDIEGYELVLAGGLLPAGNDYFKRLQFAAKNLNVRIVANPSFDTLSRLYNEASIYWHAAGYHETKPEYMEHFGISTVEAMSAGAVPVVFRGGGLPEIVHDGVDGYLWSTIDELVNKTKKIIAQPNTFIPSDRAKEFTVEKFTNAFDLLLDQ